MRELPIGSASSFLLLDLKKKINVGLYPASCMGIRSPKVVEKIEYVQLIFPAHLDDD